MHLLQFQLTGTGITSKSPDKNYQTSPNKKFVPFQRQRDSMNRLISAKPSSRSLKNMHKILRTQGREKEDERDREVYKKLNDHFKQENVFVNALEPKKHSYGKKTLIQILGVEKKIKRPSSHQIIKALQSRPSTQSTNFDRLAKTQSAQFSRPVSQSVPRIRRMNSTVLSRKAGDPSPKPSISPEQSPKKTVYYQPKVNVQQSMNKYPQLLRVRRMQELDVKLNTDFQKNHDLFLNKMIKSKQLAYDVRIGINKIDDIYY